MLVRVGDYVGWKWGYGVAQGKIVAIKHEKTQIESKGKLITRNGTPDDPAVIIEQTNGTKVLKLSRELQVLSESKD